MSETVKGEQYYIGDGENQFKDLKPVEEERMSKGGKIGVGENKYKELKFNSGDVIGYNSKPLYTELENIKNIIAGLQQQIKAMQCCGNCKREILDCNDNYCVYLDSKWDCKTAGGESEISYWELRE